MTHIRDFQRLKLRKLADPVIAEGYLKDAAKTPEIFLRAVRNVLQAREMAAVAKESGLARESLYRSFSDQGNPRYDTLTGVLGVLGLRIDVARIGDDTDTAQPPLGEIGERKNEASMGASGTHSNQIAKPGPQFVWTNSGIAQAAPPSRAFGMRGAQSRDESLGRIVNGR